ncbi:MAG: hypothetical protein J6U86_06125 [Clostridia bacterium]|nr:hypothetical protein [Clostridia bacterium]
MLFTAPAFMFVFLPLSVIFCVLFGKNRRRLCLTVVGIAYYILFNMKSPENMIWLPLLILYSYFSARMICMRRNKPVAIILGALPVAWLITMRALATSYLEFAYPVGITLPALCAAAYIWDIAYGDDAERNLGRLGMYFLFYPIMLIGPFIGYSKFKEIVDEANIEMSLERCALGIRLFSLGFIKRIAVGAVLIDGYKRIFDYSWDSSNLSIIFLLVVLIYFGAYFSIWGYYDMAAGISQLYGVNVEKTDANPFKIATVNEYCASIFGSVSIWTNKYIVSPISSFVGNKDMWFLRVCVTCICVLLFIKSELAVLALSIPLIVFSVASLKLGLDGKRKKRIGPRAVFGFLTVMLVGAVWVFITMLGSPQLRELNEITFENAEYQTDMVLMSFSGLKYLFVIIVAALSLLPSSRAVERAHSKMNSKMGTFFDYGAVVALLIMFVFTVVFFLPQFEIYNYKPFMYVLL